MKTMKNGKKLTMLSDGQKAIIKKCYFDDLWNIINGLGMAGNVRVATLADNSEAFTYQLDRQIMMTIAFKEVRKDDAKKETKKVKKTTNKK